MRRRVAGLPWGELCPDCRAERQRRATRLANRISLAATVLMAAYVAFRMPGDPMARLYGAVAVLATYIIVRRIASRVGHGVSRNDARATRGRPGSVLLALGASPLTAHGPDLAHHLQRRPGAGAARRSRPSAQGRLHPAAHAGRARSGVGLLARLRRHLAGLTYDGAVDEASVLRRSVGRRLVFRLRESKDTVSALVLGVDPLRLQLPDGRVSFTPPGRGALSRRRGGGRSDRCRSPSRAPARRSSCGSGYFTGGASWQASYQVVLGRRGRPGDGHGGAASRRRSAPRMRRCSSWPARSAGRQPARRRRCRWPEAGSGGRRHGRPRSPASSGWASSTSTRLPGRSTLLPGHTTSVALFEPAQVKYERTYVVHGDGALLGHPPAAG